MSIDFILRPWKANDLSSLVEHANNPAIAQFMTDGFPYPYTEAHGKRFIEFATQDTPIHIFAIDMQGEAVGGIGLHPQQDIMKKNAELGYWLSELYWGKGIMSQAIKQMINFGFVTYDITRIYARPFGNNLASQHLLEKTGFTLEAKIEKNIFKNGEFLDEYIYGFRREHL